MISFVVFGRPGPQGSKRHVGGGRMIEQNATVKPWREAVRHEALVTTGGYGAEDKEASVKLAIKHLEVARDEQEEYLRKVLRALYLHRTAQGKLDEAGEVELSQRTLELAAGMMNALEAARLRIAILSWRDYARQTLHGKLTQAQLREELKTIGDGLAAAVVSGSDD